MGKPRMLFAVAIGLAALTIAAPASADAGYRSMLRSGEHLTATRDPERWASTLHSPSGRFDLGLAGRSVRIDESEWLADGSGVGTTIWWQSEKMRTRFVPFDRSTFTMQRNGNLVLRLSDGRVIWASHTAVPGSYVQLLDTGNLVIRAPSGRRVWSTRTTAVYLLPGQGLASGHYLVERYRQQFGIAPTYLTMQRDGDLVLRQGRNRTWHSNTHVAGSSMRLTARGRLEVVTAHGRVVWSSPRVGSSALLSLDQCGIVVLSGAGGSWNPTHRQPACD